MNLLAVTLIPAIDAQETPADDRKILDNLWSFAVIGGVVSIVLLLLLLSRIVSNYKKSKLPIVYDGCGPSDYKVKYQIRVKISTSLEVLPGNDPKQSGSISMDLCKPNGNFIARVKVPEEPEKKKNKKSGSSASKINTKLYKFCFATSKSDKDFNIGSIRLDYSKFGERVFIYYIEIKGIEGTSSIYRCYINSKIGMLKTIKEELIPTTQTFTCKKNEGVTDQSDPLEYDLTPSEYVLFFMVASSIHCICSRYFLYDPSESNMSYAAMAQSGAATGFLSLFITFLVIVVYRIGLKKNLGSKVVNGIRILLLILLIIISFAFYVTAAILGSDLTDEQLKFWALAIGIGIIAILVVGLPAVIGFQYCCRCVSPEEGFEENETITKTLKSAIGDQHPESGFPAVQQSPIKLDNKKGQQQQVPKKIPTKMKHHS